MCGGVLHMQCNCMMMIILVSEKMSEYYYMYDYICMR